MTRKINELTIPTDGLVLDLPLDGNANARVGNNGTATNVTWVAAERGYVTEAGSFNGSSSGVTIPTNLLNISGNFTISQWVKYDTLNGSNVMTYVRTNNSGAGIIGKTAFTNSPGFSIYTGSWNDLTQSSPQLGKWYNQVLVREGTNARLYINGALDKSITIGATITDGTNFSTFGQYYSDRFDGSAGLIKNYNKALSQEEINALYSEGLRKLGPVSAQIFRSVNNDFPLYTPNSLPTPVFEISKPQSLGLYYDQSGNGNNGTATNVTDSTNGLYNIMTITSGGISWNNTSFSTSSCWELISGKWELQINPSYITTTGVSTGTRTISNIKLWNTIISSNEEKQLFYSSFLVN